MIYSVLCISLVLGATASKAKVYDSFLIEKFGEEDAFLQENLYGLVEDYDELLELNAGTPTNSREVTWRDVFDGDDAEYAEAVQDSDNPVVGATAFLATAINTTSEYSRDEALLPEDLDDAGEDDTEGDAEFLLMTAFSTNSNFTGVVIVVDDAFEKSVTLIEGLTKPTGVCFDNTHNLMYVTDLTESAGYIYQYEIIRSSDSFELRHDMYTIVYEGTTPYDCSVDNYGNLYFVEQYNDSINVINYLDLWSGFKNQHQRLYSREEGSPISYPTSIVIVGSQVIYYTNGDDGQELGLVNKAEKRYASNNGGAVESYVAGNSTAAYGVVSDDSDTYFSADDGYIYKARFGSNVTEVAADYAFEAPRGLCLSENNLFVADSQNGTVYRISDETEVVYELANVYGLHCVNAAGLLALGVACLVVF